MPPATTGNKDTKKNSTTVSEKDARPSVNLRMIRHAESRNNEVYRNARYIYRGGTPEFDEAGWWHYVETHRRADPTLSEAGLKQAQLLSEYMGPHLHTQASQPVHIITSPMRRTLETIRPTIEYLVQKAAAAAAACATTDNAVAQPAVHVYVNAFYYESDGCHTKDKAEEGMNPDEITQLLKEHLSDVEKVLCKIEFVGFVDPHRGWYCQATGAETRAESEERSAKFYLWLCHTLDDELTHAANGSGGGDGGATVADDIFDAGVCIQGEENEVDFDMFAPRLRRRRTYLLIGHGDFMSLLLKRVMGGYGYAVEHDGIPHRSAMVHHNTGMTELEYFGHGRFLLMSSNSTPHIPNPSMLSGGSLKDGWSYIVPTDATVLQTVEVTSAFADELSGHVREQTQALRALYLPSSNNKDNDNSDPTANTSALIVAQEEDCDDKDDNNATRTPGVKHFVVQRGHQVVAVGTYKEKSGVLTDVAVQPGAHGAREALVEAVRKHERSFKRSGSLVVHPRTAADQEAFMQAGYQVKSDE